MVQNLLQLIKQLITVCSSTNSCHYFSRKSLPVRSTRVKPPTFSRDQIVQSIVFCSVLSAIACPLVLFYHCIVCSSAIYSFWILLWCLQTCLYRESYGKVLTKQICIFDTKKTVDRCSEDDAFLEKPSSCTLKIEILESQIISNSLGARKKLFVLNKLNYGWHKENTLSSKEVIIRQSHHHPIYI